MNRIRKSPIVFMVIVVFMGLDAALILTGCERTDVPPSQNVIAPDGSKWNIPKGHALELKSETDEYHGQSIDKQKRNGSANGPSLTTDSKDAVNNFNASAPTVGWGGLSISAGTTDVRSTLTGKQPTSPLLWAGILIAIGGAVAFYYGLRRAAFLCFGLSGAFIAASFLPGWAWVIIALGGAAVVAFYVYVERSHKSVKEALRGVVAGVESMPDDARKVAKSNIGQHTEESDKTVIRAVKMDDGLPSERA